MRAELLQALLQDRKAGVPVAVVTRLDDGEQALVRADDVRGELTLAEAVLDVVRERLRGDRSGLVDARAVGGDSAAGATRAASEHAAAAPLFVRCHVRPPQLAIIGAVHVTQALAPMAAAAGFDVHVIDPRRAFATDARLPGVHLLPGWPGEALATLGLDGSSAVVTLSHDPKIDDPALEAALRSPAFYIGALGSRRTHEKRCERLRDAGLGDQLHRIHAPVGLDLGGRSPAEIAVSILAELIRERYAR